MDALFAMAIAGFMFIALYAGINSFTRLRIKRRGRDETWKLWPARAGDRFDL